MNHDLNLLLDFRNPGQYARLDALTCVLVKMFCEPHSVYKALTAIASISMIAYCQLAERG